MELILTLREARNLKRTQLLGAQDPYCNVSIPNIFDATTEVHHHGGSNPWWNASFLLSVPETIPSGLTLAVHIKNAMHVLPDRSIGMARVDLDALATALATDDIYHEWVPVLHKARRH
ncbi:hypothetical protein SPRG_20655 [Saprolegnia parasitica CBS 223.65]|uniref:C2 domain-containing protein n=1 Tax=Saprolegnia parasitica (strain CBS 223.65) TaxID=695850 RepID=A0A067C421_SAPPC|nr:hypothetical protein SPRG_20655 [Saprolegnia parasitica CBS 223.65]KDO25534.1 hypothetical protein SPRG_20655 [Saprolegnia parasitica CBS 223.65]|eukprot:XP_012203764.1 hypothetical protein SPRG_20655 [Saprolegnia parasitica CBS 223.65]